MKLLGCGASLESLSSSQQCSAPHVLVTAGLEVQLCWVSGTLGTIACAAWQWRWPSVPALCGLPSQSPGFSAPSITIMLLAGKSLVLVVVSVAGGCLYEGGDINRPCSLAGFKKRDKRLFYRLTPRLGLWQSMCQEPGWSS